MRIISGKWRGTALASVGKGDASAHLRPTTDRVRESLFNLLTSGAYDDPITGLRVLDLFAGTGALGLEALSRGANHACFVDNGKAAHRLIHENIAKLGCTVETTVLRVEAHRLPPNPGAPYDLIFLDPPYGKSLGEQALKVAWEGGWIDANGLIAWEEGSLQHGPPGFTLLDHRRYGDTHIHILEPV